MGGPMVRNLLRNGYPVAVWNRTPSRYAELLPAGATAPGPPRAVAASSDVLITMLEASAHVDGILAGDDGILAGVRPNSMFINMGTTEPRHAQQLAKIFEPLSVQALDAPVRGGVEAAIDGTMLIMAGGTRDAFARALPLFEVLGSKVIYAGGAGSGQLAKACLQIVVTATIEAVAEALALAQTFGAEREGIRDVLLSSQTASPLLERTADRIIAGDWAAGRRIDDFLKDRANVADALDGTTLELPLATAVFDHIRDLVASGKGDLGEPGLYLLLAPPNA